MHQVIGQCPICANDLFVSKLNCPACGTTLEGRFKLGAWHRLDAGQLHLLESFLQNQGKITWVVEDLGLSYPTVRSRLQGILAVLGLNPRHHSPDDLRQQVRQQRESILNELAAGQLTPDAAAELLQQLGDGNS